MAEEKMVKVDLKHSVGLRGTPIYGPGQGIEVPESFAQKLGLTASKAARSSTSKAGGEKEDSEPKFGMAVIGEVHPDRVLTVAGAKAGDFLVLTKAIAPGILSTALKLEAFLDGGMSDAIKSMITLNDGAARAAREAEVHACTDVTGFGLLGHLGNILTASRKGAELWLEEIPVFPHVRNRAARGLIPGGTERNLEAAADVRWDPSLDPTEKILCVDAQTSGGLLMAVAPERHAARIAALEREGTPAAATIGRVTGAAGVVHVSRSRR